MDSGSPSVSVSDESSEVTAGEHGGCRSASTRSLVDAAGNLSRTVSDVSTSFSFSEQCSSVDHSGPFEPGAAAAKLIGRSPASKEAALSRLSMKPRADVLDRRSTDDGTYLDRSVPLAQIGHRVASPSPPSLVINAKSIHMSCAEMELVKERFSKLLLGEDMSGGGKGVCTAVAISNAITNLYGTNATRPSQASPSRMLCPGFLTGRWIVICRSDGVRELPQAGAAVGGEEGNVEEGDGLPPLRLRLHRRVLPVHADAARRNQS
jgi:hypothetical protein